MSSSLIADLPSNLYTAVGFLYTDKAQHPLFDVPSGNRDSQTNPLPNCANRISVKTVLLGAFIVCSIFLSPI
jgi:hypothetical protein